MAVPMVGAKSASSSFLVVSALAGYQQLYLRRRFATMSEAVKGNHATFASLLVAIGHNAAVIATVTPPKRWCGVLSASQSR